MVSTGVVSHQGYYINNGNMTGFRGGLNRGGLSSGVLYQQWKYERIQKKKRSQKRGGFSSVVH